LRYVALVLLAASRVGSAQDHAQAGLTAVAHIALRVSDTNAELQFLSKLGYEKAFAHEQDGKIAFTFVKINDREFLEIHPRIPVDGTASLPLGFNHICFVTTDANAEHVRWAAKGLDPSPVMKGPDGTLEFGAKDPSGKVTEALQILPESQPAKDTGKHLGARRVSQWLAGIDQPVKSVAAWRVFYEAIGFKGKTDGASARMISSANSDLRVVLHPAHGEEQAALLFSIESAMATAQELKSAGLDAQIANSQVIVHDSDGNAFVFQESPSQR
jgi:lactoylglutathione lyase